MPEHLGAVDLETLGEVNLGFRDQFFEMLLALDERQLPQIVAIEIQQVESDHHDFGRLAFELVLQHREVRGAFGGGHDDLTVDNGRACADQERIVGDLFETGRPVMAPPRVDGRVLVGGVKLNPDANRRGLFTHERHNPTPTIRELQN